MFRIQVSDQHFLDQFDLRRQSMAEARSLAQSGQIHAAALSAAKHAPEGPARSAIPAWDLQATRSRVGNLFPHAVDLEIDTARLLLMERIPSPEQLGYAEDHRIGIRARVARVRGNDALICALIYAVTGQRQWAAAAIEMGLGRARLILPYDDVDFPAAYDWHPHSGKTREDYGALRVQYWMQAWGILHDVLSDEDRLSWMKVIIRVARDRLKANRLEIPHNLTLHGLMPTYQVAGAFPALRESEQWRAVIEDRFVRDFCTMPFITPDGYTREGSSYHNVNSRLLLLAYLTHQRCFGGELDSLRRTVEEACNVQAMLVVPDGTHWMLGDGCQRAHHEHWQDGHETLHLGAALFDRPDFKTMAGSTAGTGVELLNAYLMGSAGLDRWAAMPATDIQRRSLASAHADKSVFHVLRCGRGPDAHAGILCLGTEHNHAHHDKGQALIYGLGRHLITDPGVFYDQSDVDGVGQMRSSRIHAMACPIRRSPTGPRTDFGDLAVSLGRYQDQQLQVAMGQSLYYENHLVRRALALVTPWGPEAEAFWLVWDRVSWKRPWPAPCNEPLDMIDTSFPFNVPGGSAKIAADGRSVWSLYDGPDGKPFAPDAPPPNVICQAEERHDSDANIQVIRLGDDPAELWDVRISSGSSSQPGGKLWPRPVALFRWRGRMPHVVAYVLCPFRGVRDEPYASAVGQATPDGLQCRIILPAGIVTVKIDGLDAGPISGGVRV